MITGKIDDITRFFPNYPKLAHFIGDIRDKSALLADGQVPLDGECAYASIQTYLTRPPTSDAFEAHRRYADIQFLLSGDYEDCAVANEGDETSLTTDYDQDKDIFFATLAQFSTVRITKDDFAIFLPGQLHQPGRRLDYAKTRVRKCVIKILPEFFSYPAQAAALPE